MPFRPTIAEENQTLDTAQAAAAARRCTWASICVNTCLSTAQVIIGFFAHSQGLIADGIHSLSDLLDDFIVLFAAHHSYKAADEDHNYGHRRYENAASLVLGVFLLAVGTGMVWAAVKKLSTPDAIPTVHQAALWIAMFSVVAKELLFRHIFSVGTRIRSTLLITNAWHSRSDALSSLVVVAGVTGNLLGFPLLDPIAALVVGIMIGRMGWKFGWGALQDLVDRALPAKEMAAIRKTLLATDGVIAVHDLRTRKVGGWALVDVHLEVDANISVLQGHSIASAARQNVLDNHDVLNVMTHLDPYGYPDDDG